MMVVSPWAVFFDGFTAWTVNHMDIVPAFLNMGRPSALFCFYGSYRDALPVAECFSIIERGSGTDFDPDIARIFLSAREEVIRLMQTHSRI